MSRHRPNTVVLFLLWLTAVSFAAAQAGAPTRGQEESAGIDVNTLVDRMQQAQLENRSRYRPYTVTRDYRMFSGGSERPASEVVAEVSFVPPDNKTFDIKQATGSSRGEKVVRNILQEESRSAPHYERNALTRENYQFRYLGQESLGGRSCYVLELIPKRQEKDLVKGRAWVDAQNYLVWRVQGDLSKSPSWWLKAVHVTLDFSDVAGMWLQTHTRANAEVRLFGAHSLESQAMNFRTAATVARATPRKTGVRPRPTRPAVVSGAVVFPLRD